MAPITTKKRRVLRYPKLLASANMAVSLCQSPATLASPPKLVPRNSPRICFDEPNRLEARLPPPCLLLLLKLGTPLHMSLTTRLWAGSTASRLRQPCARLSRSEATQCHSMPGVLMASNVRQQRSQLFHLQHPSLPREMPRLCPLPMGPRKSHPVSCPGLRSTTPLLSPRKG